MSDEQQRRRLRKQPKRRRYQAESAVNLPQFKMPKAAQKRRRRKKTEPVRFGLNTLRRIIFSARWLSLGLLAVAVYALVNIYDEPRFYLNYIPVEGAVSISPEEIAAASELAGSHVFAVDPSESAGKIGAIPGVISSTVTLRWPNQVYIEVAEEAPVAIWIENGVEYGVAQNGRLFSALRANPTLLRIESEMAPVAPDPVVSTVSQARNDPAAMQDDSSDTSQIDAALPETNYAFIPREVLEGALQLRLLRPTIDKLYYQPAGGLSYEDGRGWRAYFGTGAQMNQKLAVYEAVVAELMAAGVQPAYISVSNHEKPYYSLTVTDPVVEEAQS
jgi:POTRA domain, FtsQ-type